MIIDQRVAGRDQDQDSDSDESLNIKELINDFATDEFVQKNVRVRPTSSYSQAGKDQSEIGARGAGGTQAEEDDEKKFNTETNYELSQQRLEQKERKKKEEMERLLELEKAEKKKRQKA